MHHLPLYICLFSSYDLLAWLPRLTHAPVFWWRVAYVCMLQCDECGASLRDKVAVEVHAAKAGHSAFSESSEVIAPLTAEEKAAKVEKLKTILAERRGKREETEKVGGAYSIG